MSQKKIRIGFIGFGRFAQEAYLDWIRQSMHVQIISMSCVDRSFSPTGLDDVRVFEDPDDMLSQNDIDIAVVSTPHSLHYRHAKSAIEAGCHVLVDKPLATNHQHALELVELSKQRNRQLAVGLERRYEVAFSMAKLIISSGTLGDVRCIECSHLRPLDTGFEQSWRNDPSLSGGGVLLDIGFHVIDAVYWLTGLSIGQSTGFLSKSGLRVEKSCSISLRFHNDAIGTFFFSYESPLDFKRESLWFYGSKASLGIENFRPDGRKQKHTLLLKDSKGDISSLQIGAKNERLNSEMSLANIVDYVLDGQPLQNSAEDTLGTIKFIQEFYERLGSRTA